MNAKVVLYSKPGCHLCDDAHAVLDEVRRELPFELDVRDISKSRKLIEAYGLDIPVVTIDGVEAFRHRLTADQLRAALGAGPGSRREP
jgi:glutaredoxin